jgi:phage terminase small subunit
MGRSRELTEKERAYVKWRTRGLNPHAAALKAGYAPSTAHVKSHRIEQRLPVRMSLTKRRHLKAALIEEIMAIIKPYVAPSKLPELANKLAKFPARRG